MASQPTRSALLLATIALGLFSNTVCIWAATTPTTIFTTNDLKSNGGGGASPKFGDRISPRHRPFVEVELISRSSSPTTRESSALKNINLNNNLSLSSAIRSRSGSVATSTSTTTTEQLFAATIAVSDTNNRYKTNSNKESDRILVVTRGSSDATTATDRDDDDINNIIYKKMYDAATATNVELPVVVGGGQQLHQSIDDDAAAAAPSRSSSLAQAHRLEMSTEFFVVPSSTASSMTRSTTIRPGGVVMVARPPPSSSDSNAAATAPTPPTITNVHNANGSSSSSGLRREPWVVPVLVLAALAMIMMAAFEIFVLCKAWRTSPSRRHLFLGQMLLLGLFACAGLAAVLTATPTLLSCATVRFGAGVAYALVFASLLVKCVFLISLNGGVYLPAPYQGLLLLFAVLIQVAVGAQWLITSPPAVDLYPVAVSSRGSGTSIAHLSGRYPLLLTAQDIVGATVPLCKTAFPELLFSLVYVVFLILFVAVLAIKSRGIRDNYREATYIGLAIGGSIPIWLGWTLCGLAVADRHKDACLAFGLVATSTTVFLVMFMPKGRQLAAMGKEGLYVEDREEQFSSLSRAGSGYSPSFFHFKPIKYGVMGPAPTSTTNTGNGTSVKHQAVATLGGGEYPQVILVSNKACVFFWVVVVMGASSMI